MMLHFSRLFHFAAESMPIETKMDLKCELHLVKYRNAFSCGDVFIQNHRSYKLAVLFAFYANNQGRTDWGGPEFKKKEKRNGIFKYCLLVLNRSKSEDVGK